MNMAKRLLFCIFLAFMLFTSISPVFAQTSSAGSTSNQSNQGNQGIIGKQMQKYYEDDEHKPGLMERTIAEPIISVSNFLLKFFGAKDVVVLVFGIDPSADSPSDVRDGLYLGVFTEGMMNAIDALYSSFERFMPFPVILAVMLIAGLLLFQGMSADGRSKAKDYMLAFLVGLLSIRFGYYLWSFVAYVTQKFTSLIWATMLDHGIKPDLFLNMIWGSGTGYDEMVKYRGFVVAILVLLAAIMSALLNYQYTMRTINLMVLVSTFMISAILTIFPKYRQSLQTWWNEFISQMLLPVAHALALGLFFLLLYYGSDDVSNWVIVAYLFGFSSIQALVFRLLGAEDSGKASMGRMMGFGTMMALGRMFRPNGGKGEKSSKSGGNEAQEMLEGGSAASAEGSSGSLAPAPAISRPKQRNWKQSAGQMGGKAAGYALHYGSRAAGAVAGTSIGFMAGNPVYGAMIGAKAGGALGKGAEGLVKGGMWLGSKAVGGFQRNKAASAIEGPEETTPGEIGGATPPVELLQWEANRGRQASSSGNNGGSQSAVQQSSNPVSGATSSTGAVGRGAGVGSSSSGAGQSSTKTGTKPDGSGRVVNSGIMINGGKVRSENISVSNHHSGNNNGSKDTVTTNPDRHNKGIWISGGDVKAKSIRVDGNTSGAGVKITGGHVQAEHISPNTDIRQDTGVGPSEQPTSTPSGRHYNYDL